MRVNRSVAVAVLMTLLAACASSGSRSEDGGPPPPAVGPQGEPVANFAWPVSTRYHIDLWLHGYAMISDDTTQVPFFKRGYREQMVAFKKKANTSTKLDANRDALHERLAAHPGYISGQFLALYFRSWAGLRSGVQIFLRAGGDPRQATDPQEQQIVALFASVFPSAADREWLETFSTSLDDADQMFYRAYWNQRQRDLAPVIARVDSLWQQAYYPKLAGYLAHAQLPTGHLILSLPLDGEGRTLTQGEREITVTLPENPDDAIAAVYVFAHEAIIPVTSVAVRDNTTPAQQRSGEADRYTSAAAVRGGAMLLQRVAPDLVAGYARYYLHSANASASASDPQAALARAFPLPDPIVDAIGRQLGVVLGGI